MKTNKSVKMIGILGILSFIVLGGVSCKTDTPDPQVNQFTVTFDADDGSAVEAAKIDEGKTVPKPTDPTKNGYTFKGWFEGEAGTAFDFENTQITADKTLKAKWDVVKYTIEYKNVKDNSPDNPTEYTIESKTITLNDPVSGNENAEGPNFVAWYSDEAKTQAVTEITAGSTGDKTFYAKWSATEVVKYNVTFKLVGTEESAEDYTIKVVANEKISQSQIDAAQKQIPEGFELKGTYSDEGYTTEFDFTQPITADRTIYVKVEKKATEEPPTSGNTNEPKEELSVDGKVLTITNPKITNTWGCDVTDGVVTFKGNSAVEFVHEKLLDFDQIEIFYKVVEKNFEEGEAKLSIKLKDPAENPSHVDIVYPKLENDGGSLKYSITAMKEKKADFAGILLANNANDNIWSNGGPKWDSDWKFSVTKIVMTKIEKLEDKVIFDPNAEGLTIPDGGEIVDKDGEKFLKITPNGYDTSLKLTSPVAVKGYTKAEARIYAESEASDWQACVKLCNYSSADLSDKEKEVVSVTGKPKTEIQTFSGEIKNDTLVTDISPFTQSTSDWQPFNDKVIYIGKITVKTE